MEIYKITNTVTNKSYVGMSVNAHERFKKHINNAISGINRRLYDSMRHHGFDKFILEIIDNAQSREEASVKEKYWISLLDTMIPNGYNMTQGGDGGYTLENWTEEDRKLLYKKQGESRRGLPTSDQKREKLSKAHSGKIISDKQRKQISETLKRKGCSPPDEYKWKKGQAGTFTGNTHSNEVRFKISSARLGKSYFDLYDEEHALDLIERRRVAFMGKNNPKFVEVSDSKKIEILYYIANNFKFNIKDSRCLLNISEYKVRQFLREVGIDNFQICKKENKIDWKNYIFNIILNNFYDVSEVLGIVKYDPPLPAQLAGQTKGNFPSLVPKTDEERVQNLAKYWNEYSNSKLTWEVTEKLEGSSCTFYLDKEGNFEVCSRNLSLKETEGNSFWKAAIMYNVKQKMLDNNLQGFAIQGELIGEGIQGNIYNLKGIDFYAYTVWDTVKSRYLVPEEREGLCQMLGLKHVPVVYSYDSVCNQSIQDVLQQAEGKSVLNHKQEREGIVFKCNEKPELHFKAISNKYLLKAKD